MVVDVVAGVLTKAIDEQQLAIVTVRRQWITPPLVEVKVGGGMAAAPDAGGLISWLGEAFERAAIWVKVDCRCSPLFGQKRPVADPFRLGYASGA